MKAFASCNTPHVWERLVLMSRTLILMGLCQQRVLWPWLAECLPAQGKVIKSNSEKNTNNKSKFTLIKQPSPSTLLRKILTHVITINLRMRCMFSCTWSVQNKGSHYKSAYTWSKVRQDSCCVSTERKLKLNINLNYFGSFFPSVLCNFLQWIPMQNINIF